MKKIHAVIFDVSGVITDEYPHMTTARLATKYKISEALLWESIFIKNYDLGHAGNLTSEQFYTNVISETKLPISYIEFIKEFLNDSLIRPKMIDLLKDIRPFVTHISIFSNQTIINTDYLHPILDPLVDASFYSNECRMVKPEREFYHFVSKNIPAKPSEILFVDDRNTNLIEAKNIGWNTYQFVDTETCISFIRNTFLKTEKE